MARGGKATVAGAGVLGLSCALALADAGFQVTVKDPAAPLANASGVAAGMLAPAMEAVLDPAAADHFGLLLAARNLWPALEARAGLQLDRTGALIAGRSDWTAQVSAGLARLGLFATDLPRRASEALAPGLSAALESVLLTREDWRLDAAAGLAGLRLACEGAGVAFSAEPVRARDGDLLVIATGASRTLADVAPELALLQPIKGHILQVEASGPIGVTVRGEGGYAVPAGEGLALGATMEPGIEDSRVDPAKGEALLEAGAQLFPHVRQAPRRLLAGVRGATPDGLPLVGASRADGVLLAVGARRNGWLLAPMVAGVIAALATDRDPGPYARRMDPARFTA